MLRSLNQIIPDDEMLQGCNKIIERNLMLIKVQKMGNNFGIIFPPEIIEAYHLNEGDTLVLDEKDEGIYLNLQDPDFGEWIRAYRKANQEYREVLQELAL